MIYRTPRIDEHNVLYVQEDEWNTMYTVITDGYVTKWDYIRRKNVCSVCGKSWPKDLKNQTHLHHVKIDPIDPAANTIEVCDDPGGSCHNKLHDGTLSK